MKDLNDMIVAVIHTTLAVDIIHLMYGPEGNS